MTEVEKTAREYINGFVDVLVNDETQLYKLLEIGNSLLEHRNETKLSVADLKMIITIAQENAYPVCVDNFHQELEVLYGQEINLDFPIFQALLANFLSIAMFYYRLGIVDSTDVKMPASGN
jgi:hypothetical protein